MLWRLATATLIGIARLPSAVLITVSAVAKSPPTSSVVPLMASTVRETLLPAAPAEPEIATSSPMRKPRAAQSVPMILAFAVVPAFTNCSVVVTVGLSCSE